MLSTEIADRLDRLLAAREIGIFTNDEFATRLGSLLTSENLGAVLARLPPDIVVAVKEGIAQDDRRAADVESLCPETSPFDCVDVFGNYYRNVASALLEPGKHNRRGLLSVVCLPSFEVEWAIRLLGSEKEGFSITRSVAETMIWSRQGLTPVAVMQVESPLPAELAASVCEAWRNMLRLVRYPQSSAAGLDGVTYHFACFEPGMGWMAGTTWSPEDRTAPGRLVALSQLLFQYVEQGAKERSRLAVEIRQAADWLRGFAEPRRQ